MQIDPRRQLADRQPRLVPVTTAVAVVLFFLPGCGSSAPKPSPKQSPPPAPAPPVASASQGQQLYARHCAACHGKRGDGQGIAAPQLFPRPRNLRAGKFRLVSTKNRVPMREDLHSVLLRGMPGSAMPPWRHLPQHERDALVDEVMRIRRDGARENYIKNLKQLEELTDEEIASAKVQEEIDEFVTAVTTPGETTEVPPIAEPTAEALARGKEVYANGGCLQCHGKEGKGDGQQKMVDDEKLPTRPRDFTRGIFKGGHDPASLYRRTAYGMPGTPMPSSTKLTPQQMIDLVHYIRSMSTEAQREAAILNREKIVVRAVAAAPTTMHAEAWSDLDPVAVRMTPLWWRNDADPDLQVQAVHDGKAMVFRLSWRDATQDGHAARNQSFEDAVALELYRGDLEPFLGMGDPKSPIDVWYWDADRQGVPLAVEDVYPNTVVDLFPFSETVVAGPELDRDGARTADQPDVSLPARAAGNPIVPADRGSGASSLTAGGPGSVTFRIPKSRLVTAQGQWQDGRWTVLLTRSLTVPSTEDGVSLQPGERASVAFAVWDGSQQDRDGQKTISIWQDLRLEQSP